LSSKGPPAGADPNTIAPSLTTASHANAELLVSRQPWSQRASYRLRRRDAPAEASSGPAAPCSKRRRCRYETSRCGRKGRTKPAAPGEKGAGVPDERARAAEIAAENQRRARWGLGRRRRRWYGL